MSVRKKFFLWAAVCLFPVCAPAQIFIWEDFELGFSYWTTRFSGALSTGGIIAPDFPSNGRFGFRGRFRLPEGGGRAAFATQQVGDLTGAEALVMDVYNSSPVPFKGFLVLKQGPNWTWHQSNPLPIQPGWNRNATFPLRASGAGPGVLVMEDFRDIREMALLFESDRKGEGYLYIDYLRLPGADPEKVSRVRPEDRAVGTQVLLTGFERGGSPFSPDAAWSSATEAEVARAPTTEGDRLGVFRFRNTNPEAKASFTLEADLDFSKVSGLRLDVYNPLPDEVELEVALTTGPEYEFHESAPLVLRPGWNVDVTFPLRSRTFKSEATGWRNVTAVRRMNQVRKLTLMFLPHQIAESFFAVDRIRLLAEDSQDLQKQIARAVPVIEITGEDHLLEGFEGENTPFQAAAGWSGAQGVSIRSVTRTTQGKKLLEVSFANANKDQASYFGIEQDLDLSAVQAVKVDLYVPSEEPLQAVLALNTGETYEWYESKPIPLKKGWNVNLTFPVQAPLFKAERTGWAYQTTPADLKKTRKLFIGFLTQGTFSGKVYMDNVRLTGEGENVLKLAGLSPRRIQGRETPWDPLETAAGGWRPSTQAADNSFSTVVFYEKVKGENVVKLKYDIHSVNQKARFFKNERLDWTGVLALKLDAYNPQDHIVNLALGFNTGKDGVYHETREFSLQPGWNRDIVIDLAGPVLKTRSSNWTYTEYLNHKDDVQTVSILLYPKAPGKGEVWLSRLRTVERDPLGALGMDALGKKIGGTSKTKIRAEWAKEEILDDFEGGASAWGGGMKALLGLSEEFRTDGRFALKVDYEITGDANPVQFSFQVPPEKENWSAFDRLAFDVYNPGPPVMLEFGFQPRSNPSDLVQSRQIALTTGWNRGVALDLTAFDFKSAQVGWLNLDTFRVKNEVDILHLRLFGPAGRHTLYLDRLRLAGSSETKPERAADVRQEVAVKWNPNDAVEVLVEGAAHRPESGRAEVRLERARVDVRGAGNELRASSGIGIRGTDDPLELVSPTQIGENAVALEERFYWRETSLQAFGFSRFGEKPHTFGDVGAYALRLSRAVQEDYQVGIGFINQLLGTAYGKNPLISETEAQVQLIQADARGYVRALGLTFEGEWAKAKTRTFAGSSLGNEAGIPDTAYHAGINFRLGAFKFSAARAGKELGFVSPFSKDPQSGFYKHNGEINWQAETFTPLWKLQQRGGFWKDLLDDFNMFAQYFDYHNRTDTYSNWSVRVVARNNDTSRLNFMVWQLWSEEGKDAGDPTLVNPAVSTRTLTTTHNTELRYRLKERLFLNFLYRFSWTDFWEELTFAGGATYQFWGNTWVGFEAKNLRQAGERFGDHTNLYGFVRKQMLQNTTEAELAFGEPSFTGFWNDPQSNRTWDRLSLRISGKF